MNPGQFDKLVRVIEKISKDLNKQADDVQTALELIELTSSLDIKKRQLIADLLISFVNSQAAESDLGLRVFFISLVLENFPETATRINLYEVCKSLRSQRDKNEFLWGILYISFARNIRIEVDTSRIYLDIVSEMMRFELRGLRQEPIVGSTKVLITTSQFLTSNHSPTAMCLDIAEAVLANGLTPIILVLRSPPEQSTLPFGVSYVANQMVKEFTLYPHNGFNIPIMPLEIKHDTGDVGRIMNLLGDIKPSMNIQVGGFNVHGEVVASLVPSFLWTTSKVFSPSVNHRFVQIQDSLDDNISRFLDSCGMDKGKYQKFFSKLTRSDGGFRSYFLPRSTIGFDEDDIIVAIIGNRLDFELGPEENRFLFDVLSLKENIKLAVFGQVSEATRARLTKCCNGKVKFFGHVLNLQDHLQSVDFFVNTRRLGGAGGIAAALYCGVLGCSIDYGDVGDSLPARLKAENYPDLLEVMSDLLSNTREYHAPFAHEILSADQTYSEKVATILKLLNISKPAIVGSHVG